MRSSASLAGRVVLTDEPGLGGEIPHWDGDHLDDVLTHHLDVVLELGRDGDDGCSLGHCACREGQQHSSTLEH